MLSLTPELLPNFFEIIKSCQNTFEETTNKKLNYFLNMFTYTCDVLASLWRVSNPPVRGSEDLLNDNDYFQHLCLSRYTQAPYSAFCLIDLWAKGFYTEAYMVYRSLFEAFIQMRYYYNHNDKAKLFLVHQNDLTNQAVPHLKEFINELLNRTKKESPPLYEFYQIYLCSASHGTAIINDVRFNPTDYNSYLVTPNDGCIYNVEHAEVIATQTILLFMGYINYFQKFFPDNILEVNIESKKHLLGNYKFVQNRLIKIIEAYEAEDEFTIDLIKDFKKIVLLNN